MINIGLYKEKITKRDKLISISKRLNSIADLIIYSDLDETGIDKIEKYTKDFISKLLSIGEGNEKNN